MRGIKYALHVHDHAKGDLRAIRREDEKTAADLLVFLQEFEGDQDLLDRLSQHGYEDPYNADWVLKISVSKWLGQWRQKRNLWRLKNLDLEEDGLRYRVIYAYLPKKQVYVVLGIFPRANFDYDDLGDPRVQRILASYDELA